MVCLSSTWMVGNHDFKFPTSDDTDKSSRCRTQRLQALRAHWDRATSGMKNRDVWFDNKIVPMHSEPGRFYHTLVHLEEMLGFLELIMTPTPTITDDLDYKSLVLTIFFHDIIYDPKSATNEQDSAQLFQDFWNDAHSQCHSDHHHHHQDDQLKSRVVSNILATKHHHHHHHHHNATTTQGDDTCMQLLLDMDMAVLGKQKEAYWTYAGLIRREYAFVEHQVYCEKRAEVLQGFLEYPQIYGTKVMADALETRARDNLKAEIESLQKGHIPESNSVTTFASSHHQT